MPHHTAALSPLLTSELVDGWRTALARGQTEAACSLDLERSSTTVQLSPSGWTWRERCFPYPARCKPRTIYHFVEGAWEPVARFSTALVKLVPTSWGPPTFEIDGIKMLPSENVSPYQDAARKVSLIGPRGKVVLDTCGGLGYFAAWCLQGHAARVISYEKNPDVLWLRRLNPWSPGADERLRVTEDDVVDQIITLADESVDAILHDPPRFGIAGELYAATFYDQLARVLRRKGCLFHYTGSPNKINSGRDLQGEIIPRLRNSGFAVSREGDGLLALKR